MSAPDPRPIATVGALILDEAGRGLFVRTHKWRGAWGVPGGKIERGETMQDALRRELREETGLEIQQVRYVTVYEAIDSPEFHKPAHMLLHNFWCRLAGGELRLNEEADEARWLTHREANALLLNSYTKYLAGAVHALGVFP